MKNPRILILLSCIVLLSARCKRRDCSKDIVPKVMIPQEVLDYVDFKAGTYWVYQDSATGRIDSEVVLSSQHYFQDVQTLNDCGDVATTRQYENIKMIIQRYDSAGNKKESWIREFDNVNKMRDHRQDDMFIIDNYASFLIGYPFNLKYYVQGYECSESILDSFAVDGKVHYNVLKVLQVFTTDPSNYFYDILSKKTGNIYSRNVRSNHPDDIVKLIRYKIM